MLINIIKKMH